MRLIEQCFFLRGRLFRLGVAGERVDGFSLFHFNFFFGSSWGRLFCGVADRAKT